MPATRGLLLTILLSVAAAAVGAWGGARCFVGQMHHPASLHQTMHESLDLTAEQDRRIGGLERDYAVRRHALEAEMRAANADLAQAIQATHDYTPAVQRAPRLLNALRARHPPYF